MTSGIKQVINNYMNNIYFSIQTPELTPEPDSIGGENQKKK
jgi:hypothetical protein